MIRTLRAFFLARQLREKVLLVAFAAIGLVIWGSAFSDRASRFWRQKAATTAELRIQQQWLNNRTKIEAAGRKAAAQLEPGKTLDGNLLYSTVREIAREAGIKTPLTGVAPAPDVTNGQFSVHTLSFTTRIGSAPAEWLALERFYAALQQKAPYIGIDQFSLGISGNPPQHSMQLKVSSVEIQR